MTLGGLAAGGAGAQSQSLPPEVVRTEGRLSGPQADQIRSFIDRGMAELMDAADADAAAAARRTLTGPLSAIGATPSFVQQYGRSLVERVGNLPADAEAPKRINALLLLRTAPPQEAIDTVRDNLDNEDPAIRFTAAKVILDLLRVPADQAPPPGGAALNQLQNELAAAAGTETDAFVVGKLLPAMQAVSGDGGRGRLIETLNQRVAVHAENPGTGYLPELAEMSNLFLRNLGNFQKSEAAGLCRASARYLKLVSEQLAAGVIPATEVDVARQMLSQSDNILRELSASQLGISGAAAPGGIGSDLGNDDFAAISATADAWLQTLAGPGTGLDAASLTVPEITRPEGEVAEAEPPADEEPAETAVEQPEPETQE